MSRLRRFNRKVLGLDPGYAHDAESEQDDISLLPLDTEEQEELLSLIHI